MTIKLPPSLFYLGSAVFLGTCFYGIREMDKKQKAEHQRQVEEKQDEKQRACNLKQEAASFTGYLKEDCSPSLIPITYDAFLEQAYFQKNNVSSFQEQAWLSTGNDIGRKIDSQRNFTKELCIYTRQQVYQQAYFLYAQKDISFLERCQTEYKVEGINAAANAYDLVIREAQNCVSNDFPKIGSDICYKRAVADLEQTVRPLATRTGVADIMWINELRVQKVSRAATK